MKDLLNTLNKELRNELDNLEDWNVTTVEDGYTQREIELSIKLAETKVELLMVKIETLNKMAEFQSNINSLTE
jgi:uncharacterized Zn finger protein